MREAGGPQRRASEQRAIPNRGTLWSLICGVVDAHIPSTEARSGKTQSPAPMQLAPRSKTHPTKGSRQTTSHRLAQEDGRKFSTRTGPHVPTWGSYVTLFHQNSHRPDSSHRHALQLAVKAGLGKPSLKSIRVPVGHIHIRPGCRTISGRPSAQSIKETPNEPRLIHVPHQAEPPSRFHARAAVCTRHQNPPKLRTSYAFVVARRTLRTHTELR